MCRSKTKILRKKSKILVFMPREQKPPLDKSKLQKLKQHPIKRLMNSSESRVKEIRFLLLLQ